MGLTYKALKYRDLKLKLRNRAATNLGATLPMEPQTLHNCESTHFTAEQILQLCRFLAEKAKAKKTLQCHQYNTDASCCSNDMEDPATMDTAAPNEGAIQQAPQLGQCRQPELAIYDKLSVIETSAAKSTNGISTQHVAETKATVVAAVTATEKLGRIIEHTQVLSDRFTCNSSRSNQGSNSSKNNSSTANAGHSYSTPASHINQDNKQDKRDILLKIRRQILERKRLRQLLRGRQQQLQHMQQQQAHFSEVWRPW